MNTTARVIACLALWSLAEHAATSGGLVRTWGGPGNETANGVTLDGSTNLYAVGGFQNTVDFNPSGPLHSVVTADGQDAYLCKYDCNGTFQWARTWGSNGADRANAVAVDGAGNAYVVGCFNGTVDFNPSGPLHANLTANGQDAFLCKFDRNGIFQWARSWGGDAGEDGYTVAADLAGNSYVVGDYASHTIDFNPDPAPGTDHDVHTNRFDHAVIPYGYDCWLCKWGPDGTFKWARTWGGNGYDDCCSLAVDELGSVFAAGFAGSTSNTCDFNPDRTIPHATNILNATLPGGSVTDAFLSKFTANGDYQWTKVWGGANQDAPAGGLAVDGLGNVYVSGYFGQYGAHDTVDFNPSGSPSNLTSQGGSDAFLCKYDAAGALQWAQSWGGTNDDVSERLAVDGQGYVYVPGVFKSLSCDFDPGPSVSNLSTHSIGTNDLFLSKFDANGKFLLARACGGPRDDWGVAVAADGDGNAYVAGNFQGSVDFGPLCGGPSTNSNGGSDAVLCRVPTGCRLTVVTSGNGWSSLGTATPSTRIVSLGVTTQIVFSSADWHRILALASNSAPLGAAAGTRIYTQALVNVAGDISNEVSFGLATPAQTGYTNVPTEWLSSWPESAIISDSAFDVHGKYLLGLDPTTSNTLAIGIESFAVAASDAVTVVKRTYTGGLSADGMHGQLILQATDGLEATFTNLPGTAVTGAAVFDDADRRSYTNQLEGARRYIRAVVQ